LYLDKITYPRPGGKIVVIEVPRERLEGIQLRSEFRQKETNLSDGVAKGTHYCVEHSTSVSGSGTFTSSNLKCGLEMKKTKKYKLKNPAETQTSSEFRCGRGLKKVKICFRRGSVQNIGEAGDPKRRGDEKTVKFEFDLFKTPVRSEL